MPPKLPTSLREAILPRYLATLLVAGTLPALAFLRELGWTGAKVIVYLASAVVLAHVVSARIDSRVSPGTSLLRYPKRWRACAWGGLILLTALAGPIFRELTRATLVARCSWSREPLADSNGGPSLSCEVTNIGTRVARDVVLELPFLCARASFDGQEGSPRFDPKVFTPDPKPPAPFSIGEVRPGRRAQMVFFPLRTRPATPEWCQPQAYSLGAGEGEQGGVEVIGCPGNAR